MHNLGRGHERAHLGVLGPLKIDPGHRLQPPGQQAGDGLS